MTFSVGADLPPSTSQDPSPTNSNLPPTINDPNSDPRGYEDIHVHEVYDSIASHFSQTRYKPWPIVEKFLLRQKSGSVGLDVGCGNGKYFGIRRDLVVVGSDRSQELVRIAARRHHHHHHQYHPQQHDQQYQHKRQDDTTQDTQPDPNPDPVGQKVTSDRQHGRRDLPNETESRSGQRTVLGHQQSSSTSTTLLRRSFTKDDDGNADADADAHTYAGRKREEVVHHHHHDNESHEAGHESEDRRRAGEMSRDGEEYLDRRQELHQQHQRETRDGTQEETGKEEKEEKEESEFRSRYDRNAQAGQEIEIRADGGTGECVDCDRGVQESQIPQQRELLVDGAGSDRFATAVFTGGKEEQTGDGGRRNQSLNPVVPGVPSKSTPTSIRTTPHAATGTAASLPPSQQPSPHISECNCISTALQASALALPHPSHTFDFAICIAVIHHLATRERRVEGIREILRTLRRRKPARRGEVGVEVGAGQALIFVWALEQATSRRGWSVGDEQDQLVPWVLKPESATNKGRSERKEKRKTRQPPPQLGCEDEARGDRNQEGVGENLGEQGRPRGSHQAGADDSPQGHDSSAQHKPEAVPTQLPSQTPRDSVDFGKTYHRFYHLYHSQELEAECMEAGGVIVEAGYERDNWWVVIEPAI